MKKSKIFLAIFILLLAGGLSAQVTQAWVARYNGAGNGTDYGRGVGVDPSGNVYVTGYSYNGSNYDIVTVKYNSAGVQQWARTYNGSGNSTDYPYSIFVDASGNVYVAGYSTTTNTDMVTLKYNTAGTLQWAMTYNGTGNSSDYGYDITVDAAGNVYTAGYGYVYNSGSATTSYDIQVVKYNSAGALQWVGTYDSPLHNYDYGRAVAVDGSGNVYVAGYGYYNNTSYYDAELVKFNSAGVYQWVGIYATPLNYYDYGYDVAVDGAGNAYLGGYTSISSTSNADILILKYNSAGVQQWMRNWNGPLNSYDYGYYLKCNNAGDVWVAGHGYYSTTGSYDLVIVKYNTAGVFQWANNYNGPGNSSDYMTTPGGMLALDASDNAYICGYYSYGSSSTYYDIATVKYNSAGVYQWDMRYDNGFGGSYYYDYGYWVAVDASNNVYTCGYGYNLNSGTYSYDFTTIKYTQTAPSGGQPDNLIKNSADVTYIGDGIYNTDGTDQTCTQTVDVGVAAVYHIRVQNDGSAPSTFSVTGTASGSSAHGAWTVTYYDALSGGSDITSSVTGAGWSTGSLAPGAARDIRVEVVPGSSVWGLETYDVLVTSTNSADPTKIDAVRATTTAREYCQPDNLVKRADAATYVGDDIYNADGTDQTASYVTNYWNKSVFDIEIENGGNTGDSYIVTGPGSSGGWTVQYFDALSGGSDITSEVTGGGWATGTLDPDGFREIRVEITGSATADSMFQALVTSTSTQSTSEIKELDAVKCVVVSASAQPDAMLKNSDETVYTGDNVYNQTGEHQTKAQTIIAGAKGVFHVQIENDYLDEEGNPDVFTVKATAGNSSWNVKYYDMLVGGNDITAAITGSGWMSGEILPLNTERIRIEVTPDTTMADSSFYEITVRLTSSNDGNRRDVVKAIPVFRKEPAGIGEDPKTLVFGLRASAEMVQYSLARATNVSLKVYDVAGNLVATLASGSKTAGSYTVGWKAPSKGVYFVKLASPEYTAVRKIAVIK